MAQSGTLNTGTYNNSNFFVDWSFVGNNGKVATINYSIGLNMTHYAWWGSDAVMIKDVYIGGKKVTSGGTYSNLSGNPNNRQVLITGSTTLNVDSSGSVNFNIDFYGWLYENGDIFTYQNFTLTDVLVTPTISLAQTHTATTINVTASVTNGINAEKYSFNCNGVIKEGTSNIVLFDNLTSNTSYTIRAQAYANGDWGAEASITTKTNQQNTISNIGDFTLDGVTLTITGNPNDKSTIKVLVNGQVIITRTNVSVGTYNLELTQAEKDTIYSLIGDNSSLASVIRIETGSASVDYNKSITLTGDVFSCYVNVNGVVKRGKVWVGTPQGNKQGIFTIGTSKGNVRGR